MASAHYQAFRLELVPTMVVVARAAVPRLDAYLAMDQRKPATQRERNRKNIAKCLCPVGIGIGIGIGIGVGIGIGIGICLGFGFGCRDWLVFALICPHFLELALHRDATHDIPPQQKSECLTTQLDSKLVFGLCQRVRPVHTN